MDRIQGYYNQLLGQNKMNLFVMVDSVYYHTTQICSSNFFKSQGKNMKIN